MAEEMRCLVSTGTKGVELWLAARLSFNMRKAGTVGGVHRVRFHNSIVLILGPIMAVSHELSITQAGLEKHIDRLVSRMYVTMVVAVLSATVSGFCLGYQWRVLDENRRPIRIKIDLERRDAVQEPAFA